MPFDLERALEEMGRGTQRASACSRGQQAPVDWRSGSVRPTFEQLVGWVWPGPLHSTYFVQVEADVATMRQILPCLAGRNVGLAANLDALIDGGAYERLLAGALVSGIPVYIDSGVVPRAMKGGLAPDWQVVFRAYTAWVERAPLPDLLSVTAPDVLVRRGGVLVGDDRATFELQRKYETPLRRIVQQGVRVVFPLQAKDSDRIVESFERIVGRFPGGWVGVPMRAVETTPLGSLVLALVRFGRQQREKGGSLGLLPPLHLLGIGSGERLAEQASRLSALYRVLSGPRVYEILSGRQVERQTSLFAELFRSAGRSDSLVANYLVDAPIEELEQLAGCVQTHAFFPCPPGGAYTFPQSHPVVLRFLRETWQQVVERDLPVKRMLETWLSDYVEVGQDDLTQQITGRSDLVVSWAALHEAMGGDWTDDCIDLVEEAERTDPCMVEGAWDADDLEALVRYGGLDRLQSDSSSVAIAAGNGRWIVDGMQRRATPAWWRAMPKAYRFAWNLRAMIEDRVRSESRVRYAFPTGYDSRGFTWGSSSSGHRRQEG